MDSDEGWNRWLVLPLSSKEKKGIFVDSFPEKAKGVNIAEGINHLSVIPDSWSLKAQLRFHKDPLFANKCNDTDLFNDFKENNFHLLDCDSNNNPDDHPINNLVLQKLPYI